MGEHWYKEAVIYELHVRCFYDSSGDGIGDFKGLTAKLDYLQDLGVTAIWLLPFYPSPLKDDGYDIADYNDVHPLYGQLSDFKEFLKEAHKRRLKVITELVINHTSDQHPWFQKARRAAPGSKERDFYVWSDTPDKYKDARVIFQDFEVSNWAWDREAKCYYWHRFYSHQPDLNFENPAVHAAILKKLQFWFRMGVDGMRLDAVPYLYEQEGTHCENLPQTHAFLKKIRSFVDSNFENRMLLAEANQWPEDAAKYFGEGDECHMAFHFPVMPRLFMSIHLEDSLPIVEIMHQTPKIPSLCQWAVFLRNHDELTLEMVTDEERDYMWRVYAHDPQARLNLGIRRRLAPLLKNDRRKIELMNSLLFSLNGTPVLYYGDEIGMGDNIYLGDRNGVRTPMQWSSDRNAGFSRANPQQLYLPPIVDPEYHYETVNVEAQLKNPHSLLWWTKQLISLRKKYKAFSYGSIEFLNVENRKVLVFFREYERELILVIANLSRFPQYVELDLKKYSGYNMVEIFASERFPPIGDLPYFITLGAYGYYWFAISRQEEKTSIEQKEKLKEKEFPQISYAGDAEKLFLTTERRLLESIVRKYLFKKTSLRQLLTDSDRARTVISDHFSLGHKLKIHIVIVELSYSSGLTNHLPLFLQILEEDEMKERIHSKPENIVALLNLSSNTAKLIYDMSDDPSISAVLLEFIKNQRKKKTEKGDLKGIRVVPAFEEGICKIFSPMEEGMNPDVEMRLFLAQKTQFRAFLPLMGYVEYHDKTKTPLTLAEAVSTSPPQYNAMHTFVEAAERFLESVESGKERNGVENYLPELSYLSLSRGKLEPPLLNYLAEHLEVVRVLGKTTADFHLAMVSVPFNTDFSPTAYTLFYQRSLYQTMLRKVNEAFTRLRKEGRQAELSNLKQRVLNQIALFPALAPRLVRIRYHGNYVLENLYYVGKEFLITNFGGNPTLTYAERKYKRSPLRDVVSMLLSIAEAGFEASCKLVRQGLVSHEKGQLFAKWGQIWGIWMGSAFLRAYFKNLKNSSLLPEKSNEIDFIIGIFLIERCLEKIADPKTENIHFPLTALQYWLTIYEKFQL